MSRIVVFWLVFFSAVPANAGPGFVFFGTSTFLIENKNDQILIDAYLSRPKAGIWRKMSPDLQGLREIINRFAICPSRSEVLRESDPEICHSGDAARLEWIVPMHGHYDHALDAGIMALWSGARLAGGRSAAEVLEASRELDPGVMGLTGWRPGSQTGLMNPNQESDQYLSSEDTMLRLFATPHGKTPLSLFMKGETSSKLAYPASVFAMKEGVTLSAHLTTGEQSYLFIPSAGRIGDAVRKREIKADIVFLGIGATCSRTIGQLASYWQDTVMAAAAKRVFLVHWDNSLGLNPKPDVRMQPYMRCLKTRIMPLFEKFASMGQIDILTPPFHTRFDPYTYR